jgi:hypothetical protein
MATASEKGFVRIVLNSKKKDSDENEVYDSPFRTKAQCMTILEKFKVAKDELQVFDLALTSGAHVFLDTEKIDMAWYIPESFTKHDEH